MCSAFSPQGWTLKSRLPFPTVPIFKLYHTILLFLPSFSWPLLPLSWIKHPLEDSSDLVNFPTDTCLSHNLYSHIDLSPTLNLSAIFLILNDIMAPNVTLAFLSRLFPIQVRFPHLCIPISYAKSPALLPTAAGWLFLKKQKGMTLNIFTPTASVSLSQPLSSWSDYTAHVNNLCDVRLAISFTTFIPLTSAIHPHTQGLDLSWLKPIPPTDLLLTRISCLSSLWCLLLFHVPGTSFVISPLMNHTHHRKTMFWNFLFSYANLLQPLSSLYIPC